VLPCALRRRSSLSLKLAGLNANCTAAANFPGLFPLNTGSAPSNPTSFVPGLLNNNLIGSGLVKMDYHPNEKHTLNALYFISQGQGTFNDAAGQVSSIWETQQYMRAQVGSGELTKRCFNPAPRWCPNLRRLRPARLLPGPRLRRRSLRRSPPLHRLGEFLLFA
jgi:hypothetical protein